MILFPNAKVNIGLNILLKRADGFHELETFMYPIGLTDILTINKSHSQKTKLNFNTTGIHINGEKKDNLIFKAYEIIAAKHTLPYLDIHLHKSIPYGAGLGGGSADCAFAIKGINELCNLNLSVNEMESMAAELGSDCPFFIQNKPAIAKGRGEKLELFNIDLASYTFVIVIPPIPISTKIAYGLVKPFIPTLILKNSLSQEVKSWKNSVFNNFEDSVFSAYPEIKNIKEVLYKNGASYAALSGSGSAVFGIFDKRINLNNLFPKSYFIWSA